MQREREREEDECIAKVGSEGKEIKILKGNNIDEDLGSPFKFRHGELLMHMNGRRCRFCSGVYKYTKIKIRLSREIFFRILYYWMRMIRKTLKYIDHRFLHVLVYLQFIEKIYMFSKTPCTSRTNRSYDGEEYSSRYKCLSMAYTSSFSSSSSSVVVGSDRRRSVCTWIEHKYILVSVN